MNEAEFVYYDGKSDYRTFLSRLSDSEIVIVDIPHLTTNIFNEDDKAHRNVISFLLYSKPGFKRILDISNHCAKNKSTERFLYDDVFSYLNIFQIDGVIVQTKEEFEITKAAYKYEIPSLTFDLVVYWEDEHEICHKRF